MKKIISILAAAMAIAVSCTDPTNTPTPGPTPTPSPKPDHPDIAKGFALVDANGEIKAQGQLGAAVGFVSEAGMYSFYASDVASLTKDQILQGYEFPQNSNVVAVSTLFSLVGNKVDITTEMMHWMLSAQLPSICEFDLFEGSLDEAVAGGYFLFNIDKDGLKSSLEVKLDLAEGGYIWCQSEGPYTPGGENETYFEWNTMSRPVRAAFYDNTKTGNNPPLMYFTNGQIDWGEEIDRTTYARILPSAEICDGKSYDIARAISEGSLEFMIRDFDSEWDVVSGTISIKHIKDFEYEVIVNDAEAEDRNHKISDRSFKMFFTGELKDLHLERPVPCQFEFGGKTYQIKSCVVDLSSDVAAIYMVQTEGITTISAAQAANPLVINFSTRLFGTSIGLSTDRQNFAVNYGGDRWDASNLDTGSFICHEYNQATGLLHCQLANICLKTTYKTVVKLEYKGTPVYVK